MLSEQVSAYMHTQAQRTWQGLVGKGGSRPDTQEGVPRSDTFTREILKESGDTIIAQWKEVYPTVRLSRETDSHRTLVYPS